MAPQMSAARRAHEEIKKLIMSGELPLRARIDIDALARQLSLSSMPVRQALALLLWERLLRPGGRGGYEVALWSELELADLFAWRGDLMALSLTYAPPLTELRAIGATQPYAQAVWNVMRACDRGANSAGRGRKTSFGAPCRRRGAGRRAG